MYNLAGSSAKPGCLHDPTVRQDDLEVQDVLLDGAVAHRVGSAGACGAHTADGRVGARIHWKP